MQQILRDMLIWLVSFFGIAATVLFVVRWGLQRSRKQRAERLRLLETRFRETPDGLGLPLVWISTPHSQSSPGDRSIGFLRWLLFTGFVGAGVAWSAWAKGSWNWQGLILGGSLGLINFLMLSLWLYCKRRASMPRQTQRLAACVRWWAIRLAAGIDRRLALEQSARQLQRFDLDLSRVLEAAALTGTGHEYDLLQRAFYPCGTGVAERLADVVSGRVPDALTALRSLADQLDAYYQNQLLIRVKSADGWLKYPIALCLVPAVNLLVFSPAISNLIDSFGLLK